MKEQLQLAVSAVKEVQHIGLSLTAQEDNLATMSYWVV